MFIPLLKADATQRLVYGSFDETPDHSGEICDYATAKPAFQAWSDAMAKASDGENLGNVRAQHDLKKAAGKLISIDFDDEAKRIDFCAKIVDDDEWKKVEERVYTGFSPGGRYAKRWGTPPARRYTPVVGELSIVDMPCNPAATFTMVKADGSEEVVEFVLAKAYEPGNEATLARAGEMQKAAGKGKATDYVAKARAALIAERAEAELVKLAGEESEPVEPTDDQPVSPLDKITSALAKADATLEALKPASAPDLFAGAPFAVPGETAMALIGADLTKSFAAVALIRDAAQPLAKGIYSIKDVADSLQRFAWIAQDVCSEEKWENDGASPLPQQAVTILTAMKTFLVAMIEEEVAELLTRTKAEVGDTIVLVVEGEGEDMELANAIVDLVKANDALMEKAGARNNKSDAATIQSMHDGSVKLGASCDMQKSADDVAKLTKALDDALPRLEMLSESVEELTKTRDESQAKIVQLETELATVKAQPGMAKGAVMVVDRENDNGAGDDDAKPTPETPLAKRFDHIPAGPKRAEAILAAVGSSAR